MNISEANAFFTLYRAMLGGIGCGPDDAAEAAAFLAKRSRSVLGAGPDADVVSDVFSLAAEGAIE